MAIQYQIEAIRDAFINGINSNEIQQQWNSDMTLEKVCCKVHAYESEQKHSEN